MTKKVTKRDRHSEQRSQEHGAATLEEWQQLGLTVAPPLAPAASRAAGGSAASAAATSSDDGSIQELLIVGLATNAIFLCGAVNLVAFSVMEMNGQVRSNTAAEVTYLASFVCFLTSGLVELGIDVLGKRTVRHGRYSASSSSESGLAHWRNMLISVVFAIGTVLDIVAFFLWDDRDFQQEHRVLFASSHTWLLSAAFVLVGVFSLDGSNPGDVLDGAGSCCFIIAAVVDCVVRYLDDPLAPKATEELAQLEFSFSPLILTNAVCYVLADVFRLKQQQQKQQHQHRAKVEAINNKETLLTRGNNFFNKTAAIDSKNDMVLIEFHPAINMTSNRSC